MKLFEKILRHGAGEQNGERPAEGDSILPSFDMAWNMLLEASFLSRVHHLLRQGQATNFDWGTRGESLHMQVPSDPLPASRQILL